MEEGEVDSILSHQRTKFCSRTFHFSPLLSVVVDWGFDIKNYMKNLMTKTQSLV